VTIEDTSFIVAGGEQFPNRYGHYKTTAREISGRLHFWFGSFYVTEESFIQASIAIKADVLGLRVFVCICRTSMIYLKLLKAKK
jgi:hypothetical protein